LRRFAYSLTANLDEGDDLVQEACARALSNLDKWQPGTRLDSWMYRIAQNLWVDRVRAKKVRGESVDIDVAADIAGSDGRTIAEQRSALAVVNKALATLGEEQRTLVALICVDGRSYKEAAEILNLPLGTVMSRLARARKALHEALEGQVPVPSLAGGERQRHG
jgi:RNA polymerase sigma-70 factor (ECF subfamily)